jgi:TonB family protein
MFEPDPNQAARGRRRGRSWLALIASALAHAGLLAWFGFRASPALAPERTISVVFLTPPSVTQPQPGLTPAQREAERARQAYLDRLVQPVEAPAAARAAATAPPAASSGAGAALDPQAVNPNRAAAAAGEDAAPVEAGGDITRPVLLNGGHPAYTRAAQIAGLEGDVVLKAVIDERGRVTHLEVLRGLALGLDDAAIDTVRRWKFKPSTRNGKPVKVFYILTVHFRL